MNLSGTDFLLIDTKSENYKHLISYKHKYP